MKQVKLVPMSNNTRPINMKEQLRGKFYRERGQWHFYFEDIKLKFSERSLEASVNKLKCLLDDQIPIKGYNLEIFFQDGNVLIVACDHQINERL